MNNYDILTKRILKTHSVKDKCVQILYSSIPNSKIHPKCTKPIDWMGWIQTACLLCIRITLEITALRVMCIDGVEHWQLKTARFEPPASPIFLRKSAPAEI